MKYSKVDPAHQDSDSKQKELRSTSYVRFMPKIFGNCKRKFKKSFLNSN